MRLAHAMPRATNKLARAATELKLGPRLTLAEAGAVYEHFRSLSRQSKVEHVVVDFADVRELDSAGALTVSVGTRLLEECGKSHEFARMGPEQQAAFDLLPQRRQTPEQEDAPTPFEYVGLVTLSALKHVRDFVKLVTDTVRSCFDTGHPRRRVGSILEQAVVIGADATIIVALLGLLVGVILAFQSAYQLEKFGAEIYMAEIVGLGTVREFGALITAIILSGRSGAAMAAELGTMKVNEEIDALQAIGIDPVRFLVLPRIVAISLVQPLLSLLAMAVGMAGGIGIAGLTDLPTYAVYQRVADSLMLKDFVLGITKSLLFAWIIGFVGCYMGLSTRGGANSVGRNTTRAVVASTILIIITDSIVTTSWTLTDVG